MNNLKKGFFLVTFFFLSLPLFCQDFVPFKEFLETLETQFDCRFSYKVTDVTQSHIEDTNLPSLEEALNYLQRYSLFDYTKTDDKTIAISLKNNLSLACGFVNNRETGKALSGVLVQSPYQSISTGSEGSFELLVQHEQDMLHFQHAGFTSLQLPAADFSRKPCSSIYLNQKVETLSTVTLSNYLAKGISKNLNGSLTVNYKEFDILPGLIEPDVLLTIQALPGIQSVNETVSYINIRGGSNDQNLILWDGIKMYQNGHFFGLISAFNPQLTDRVTLIKNGTPASLGDGVSGVIAMESSNTINRDFRIGAGLNLLSADAYVDVPLGTMGSLQVAGRKSLNSLFSTATYNAYYDRAFQNTEVTSSSENFSTSDDVFQFYDTSIRALVQPTEKDRFRFNFLILGNSLEFLENATVEGVAQSLQSDLRQDNISGGIYYQHLWSNRLNTEVQAYGNNYLLEATNYDILNNQRLIQKNKIEETSIQIKNNWQMNATWDAQFGYQFIETGITNFEQINNPFFERIDKQVLRTNSFFAETHFKPFSNTLLNMGVRVNHVAKFDEWLFEPRVSFNHRFLNYFTFEVLGEIKSQTATQVIDFQTDFLGVENRRWILSKPGEIPILKSNQLSAGISMNRKGWLVSAEPYIKEVWGITTQSQGFQNQFQNERTHGSYMVQGVDFLLNKRFKNLNTWLSYSYAKNDYTFEELEPSEFPNNIDIRHTLTCGVDYNWNGFNVAGGVNWHTGKPTTLLVPGNEVVDNTLNFDSPNAGNIDDYIRVDLSATYRFSLGGGSEWLAGVSLWNILDRQNVINHFFRVDESGDFEEVDAFALRFTPNFALRVTL